MADPVTPVHPQPGLPLLSQPLTYPQLHEQACVVCDSTGVPLLPAGYRTLHRLTWAVVTCPTHTAGEANQPLPATADPRTADQLCVVSDYVQRAWHIAGMGVSDPRRFLSFTEASDERDQLHTAMKRAGTLPAPQFASGWGTPRTFR